MERRLVTRLGGDESVQSLQSRPKGVGADVVKQAGGLLYRRTQFGATIVATVGAAVVLVAVIGAQTGWHPVSVVVEVLLALVLLLFWSLTIEIDPVRLRCFFGPGLIGREFPLHEIVSAAAVQNRWYYGWGIRLTPHGWMFNVSGLEAVELGLASGRRFRVGTDRPEEVVAVLEGLTALRPAPAEDGGDR